MKFVLIVTSILMSFTIFGQFPEVKFTDAQYANGMTYPKVVLSSNVPAQDAMNKDLQSKIVDLKESDFCIGQYGYVQKSSHIQIHLYCTCIDYDESVNRYFLYNIESGDAVAPSDMINPKMKEQLGIYLLEKATSYASTKGIELVEPSVSNIKTKSIDAFKIILKIDGIDLWLLENDEWGKDPMYVPWADIKKYLRYNFI